MILRKKLILVLCANSWDKQNLMPDRHPKYEFVFAGGELIENLTIVDVLRFDIFSYMRKIADSFDGCLDGVIGTGDYPGCMLAAGIASRLGLPTPALRDIVLLSHKFYSREIQKKHAPDATPGYETIDPFRLNRAPRALNYPIFVKPVKGTMSIRAQLVQGRAELRQALRFSLRERFAKCLLLRPYQHLLRIYSDGRVPAHHFISEEPLKGVQVTVDGFMHDASATVMGIVDSLMYSGTICFERFEYPSRLPASVQERMAEIAVRTIEGSGLDHACFNIEMFYDEESDRVSIIEINPRMSYQFGDLYERVDGMNTYEIQLSLATSTPPCWSKGRGKCGAAASFVMRLFSDAVPTALPSREELDRVEARFPGIQVRVLCTLGERLSAQDQDVGSFRYCIVNMGASNAVQLHADYGEVRAMLTFRFSTNRPV